MQLKTLLNRVHPVKGVVYEKVQIVRDRQEPNGIRLTVHIRPRGQRPEGQEPADVLSDVEEDWDRGCWLDSIRLLVN